MHAYRLLLVVGLSLLPAVSAAQDWPRFRGPNGSGLGSYPSLSAAIHRHTGAAPGSFTSDGVVLIVTSMRSSASARITRE